MALSIKWPDPKMYQSLSEWAADLTRVLQTNLSSLPEAQQVGSTLEFPGTVLPAGWLQTDGSTFSVQAYPALFQFLGSSTLPIRAAAAGFTSGIKAQ
jgi:Phage Tail Collar Domain